VALLADIEKAFLQLVVDQSDRNYVRFLWLKRYAEDFDQSDIKIVRLKRVAFGVVASPFLLNAVVCRHLHKNCNEFTDQIARDFYADNLCTGVRDDASALRLFETYLRHVP